MRDTALVLRDGSTDLTADENLTFSVPRIYVQKPLAVHVLFPQDLAEASDTVVVTVSCTTSGQKITVSHTDTVVTGGETFPFNLILPIPPVDGQDFTVNINVTDADAGTDFDAGAVQVWVEELAGYAKLPSTP